MSPTKYTDTRSIEEARAEVGLTVPSYAEKLEIFRSVSIPSSGIFAETGGYEPNRIAAAAHKHPARCIFCSGAVRSGKSLGGAMEAVAWCPHSDLVWLVAPAYDKARQEFEYMADALLSLGWVEPNAISLPQLRYHPCSLETMWGCRVETRSLHDVNTLASRAPDFVLMCEPGLAPEESYGKARERLTTRRGRLWLAGTFEDIPESWLEDLWRRWIRWPNADSGKSFCVPMWLNRWSFPGGRNSPEIQSLRASSHMDPRMFLLRVVGVPTPSSVLVMSAYWDPRKHVRVDAAFRPTDADGSIIPVELAIDPGYSSNYVVEAIQVLDGRPCVVDEVAAESRVHEEVIAACRARPWWGNVTGGTIDPYAGASHIFGAHSPQEVWWRVARVALRMPPRWSVDDTVGRLQVALRDQSGNASFFVSPKATRFAWEMTHWRRKHTRDGYGAPSERNCDAAKAVAYWLAERYHRRTTGGFTVPIVRPYSMR